MIAVLAVLLIILPALVYAYISSIIWPILIFTGLLILFIYRKITLGIIIDIYVHILALIGWAIMRFGHQDSFGFSNLSNSINAGLVYMAGLFILIVFIIVYFMVKASNKNKDTNDQVQQNVQTQPQPVGTMYCQYCGFPNSSDNIYCFKCNKRIK